jgi:Zn-dependent oligopeptidase
VDRGQTQDGAYVITLSRSLVEPFITFSERRDLREKAWKLWTTRGWLRIDRVCHWCRLLLFTECRLGG